MNELQFVEKSKKRKNPLKRNIIISIILVVFIGTSLLVYINSRPPEEIKKHYSFDPKMVGELISLRCTYHNIAVKEEKGGFLNLKKENIWIEYDAIVEVGIDVNQVKIDDPTDDGIVKIYLPPAKIISVSEDGSSIQKIVADDSLLNKITTDDERQIIIEANEKLKQDVEKQNIIKQSYESAKEIIEQYVTNVGEMLGKDYKVAWVDESGNISA